MIDRLVLHSEVISLEEDSYRSKTATAAASHRRHNAAERGNRPLIGWRRYVDHEPVVFGGVGGIAAPGVFGGHVQRFAQAGVTGFGGPTVASGHPE